MIEAGAFGKLRLVCLCPAAKGLITIEQVALGKMPDLRFFRNPTVQVLSGRVLTFIGLWLVQMSLRHRRDAFAFHVFTTDADITLLALGDDAESRSGEG